MAHLASTSNLKFVQNVQQKEVNLQKLGINEAHNYYYKVTYT